MDLQETGLPESVIMTDTISFPPMEAKNIIAVGAVNPIPGGYNSPADVVLAEFSSWGPSDDGRIKPDLVADGINVLPLSALPIMLMPFIAEHPCLPLPLQVPVFCCRNIIINSTTYLCVRLH